MNRTIGCHYSPGPGGPVDHQFYRNIAARSYTGTFQVPERSLVRRQLADCFVGHRIEIGCNVDFDVRIRTRCQPNLARAYSDFLTIHPEVHEMAFAVRDIAAAVTQALQPRGIAELSVYFGVVATHTDPLIGHTWEIRFAADASSKTNI